MQYDMLKYRMDADYICLWCSCAAENQRATAILNDFLAEIATSDPVFFYGYRLPEAAQAKLLGDGTIAKRLEPSAEPFHTYLQLHTVKMDVTYAECATQTSLYYRKAGQARSDFSFPSAETEIKALIQAGILSACFSTLDQGADYWFQSDGTYTQKVRSLLQDLQQAGCKIKSDAKLRFPYA